MENRLDAKGKIQYPCVWLYKIIGIEREKVEKALHDILAPKENIKINFSNISKKGNYLAFNVEVKVKNEQQRNSIYIKLKEHQDIKMVL